MKLLHIDSSILGAGSVSRTLSSAIVAAQRAQHPGLQVSYRDLAAEPVGHLSGAHLAAGRLPQALALRLLVLQVCAQICFLTHCINVPSTSLN